MSTFWRTLTSLLFVLMLTVGSTALLSGCEEESEVETPVGDVEIEED